MTDEQLMKQALAALEVGHEYAVETTEHFHIEMAGYKQQRHDAMDAEVKQIADAIAAIREALAEQPAQRQEPDYKALWQQMCERCDELDAKLAQQQEPNKDGSPCPEFWDWLPKAYNFEGAGNFTKYNMEVAFLAGKQSVSTQEPVAWMDVNKSTHETKFQKHMRDFVDHSLWSEVPLYGEPLANHELQCVCGAVWMGDEMVHLPDKRPPASKPWVGLTQQDINIAFDDTQEGGGFDDFAHAIEAKLREKNA